MHASANLAARCCVFGVMRLGYVPAAQIVAMESGLRGRCVHPVQVRVEPKPVEA
jgi:hypothetical protein